MCGKPEEYAYSSYADYLSDSDAVDTAFVLQLLPLDAFIHFNNAANDDQCLEIHPKPPRAVTDDRAREIIYKYSHCQTAAAFQALDEKQKRRTVGKIHEKGVSIRQLSRLTGISKGNVEKYLKD